MHSGQTITGSLRQTDVARHYRAIHLLAKMCVQLIGNLGMDVETMDVGNGGKLAKARLATSDYYYNKEGEKVEST